jgi:hypothetical protein
MRAVIGFALIPVLAIVLIRMGEAFRWAIFGDRKPVTVKPTPAPQPGPTCPRVAWQPPPPLAFYVRHPHLTTLIVATLMLALIRGMA